MMGTSPELRTLKKDAQHILDILNCEGLEATAWLGQGLIRKQFLSEAASENIVSDEKSAFGLKNSQLMKVVEEQTEKDPSKFQQFIELLKEKKSYRTLVAKLLNSLAHLSKKKAVETTNTATNASSLVCTQPKTKRAKRENTDNLGCHLDSSATEGKMCGCGQCSIESFFRVGCALLREESSFPYINADSLCQSERLWLLEYLNRNSRTMYDALQNLKMEFQDWSKESVSLGQLKEELLSLEGMDPSSSSVQCPMLEDRQKEIESATSILKLYCLVYDYCSWFNYYILDRIITDLVNKTGWPVDKFEDALVAYKAVMEDYCKYLVVECPTPSTSYYDSTTTFFRLKIAMDHHCLSVHDVRSLHCKIAQALHIHVHALKLCHVGDGNSSNNSMESVTQFIYSTPNCLYRILFPLAQEQTEILVQIGFIELQAENYHLKASGNPMVLMPSFPVYMSDQDHERLFLQYGAKGDLGRLRILVKAGYQPSAVKDENGCTALHLACSNGHENMVKYLVGQGLCDPNDRDNSGDSALDRLCHIEYYFLIRYMLTIHGIDASGRGCQRLMLKYAENGDFQMMRSLIEAGCDPRTSRDKDGQTALHLACKQGREHMVQYLTVDKQCDPNSKDASGETPLDKACRWGHLNIVHFLLDVPEIDATGPGCCKLLLKSSCTGTLETVKKLVEAGCMPKIVKDSQNRTALHMACQYGHLDVSLYLIGTAGCDPNNRDINGDSCLDVAIQTCPRHCQVVDYLLGLRGIDASGKACQYILHSCAQTGDVDLMRQLVEAGCSPTARGPLGCTALEIACLHKQIKVVNYLCSLPDVMATGELCLAMLLEATGQGDLETIRKLVKSGCNPRNARDKHGHIVLDIAREHNHTDILQFYVEHNKKTMCTHQ